MKWFDVHEQAFLDLKEAIQKPLVLRPPHWDEEFILQVDASNRGLGAILCQKGNEGEEHPVAYASRRLQPREQKLSTTKKECLGTVWAVELFRYYLYAGPLNCRLTTTRWSGLTKSVIKAESCCGGASLSKSMTCL